MQNIRLIRIDPSQQSHRGKYRKATVEARYHTQRDTALSAETVSDQNILFLTCLVVRIVRIRQYILSAPTLRLRFDPLCDRPGAGIIPQIDGQNFQDATPPQFQSSWITFKHIPGTR